MKKRREHHDSKVILALGIFILVVLGVFIQQLRHSLFFNHRDRLNIVMYDSEPRFYSIGLNDDVHYKGTFNSQMSLIIPGGYGRYALQSLGKLSQLEKKPPIIQKAFSSLLSVSIDYYFYNVSTPPKPDLLSVMLYKSNVHLLDRIYIYFLLINKKESDYSDLSFNIFTNKPDDPLEDHYFEKYLGYFYQQKLRKENRSIQIIYSAKTSMATLSRIIEGEGIRIVDTTYSQDMPETCQVVRNQPAPETEAFLKTHFGCIIQSGNTGGQDMIVKLGKKIEKEWE